MALSFPRTLGQSHAKGYVEQALVSGAFPHALLLHGPRGLGQVPLALDTAQLLLALGDPSLPPVRTDPCRNEHVHFLVPMTGALQEKPDTRMEAVQQCRQVLVKEPYGFASTDKESIAVKTVRALRERLSFAESRKNRRIVLILHPERMRPEAANALLKTLEEPPEGVHFLLASEHKPALLPTILSRCVQLVLQPLDASELDTAKEKLQERLGEAFLPEYLPLCDGSPGTFLDYCQNGGSLLLEAALGFLEHSLQRDWEGFRAWMEGRDQFGQMESAVATLNLVLHVLRLFHRKAFAPTTLGAAGSFFETERARQLAPLLEKLSQDARYMDYHTAICESIRAMQHYCKPVNTLMANYLEFHLKGAAREKRAA